MSQVLSSNPITHVTSRLRQLTGRVAVLEETGGPPGPPGPAGTSVTNYTTFYQVTNSTTPPAVPAASATVPAAPWMVNPGTTSDSNRFLWAFTRVTLTNFAGVDSWIHTPAAVIGTHGQPGNPGQPGAPGRPGEPGQDGQDGTSIIAFQEWFQLTNNPHPPVVPMPTVAPPTPWTTTPQVPTATNRFVWGFTRVMLRNAAGVEFFQHAPAGGDPAVLVGSVGAQGTPGRDVERIEVHYRRNISATDANAAPGDPWETHPESTTSELPFLWTRTRFWYSDGEPPFSDVYLLTQHNPNVIGAVDHLDFVPNVGGQASSLWTADRLLNPDEFDPDALGRLQKLPVPGDYLLTEQGRLGEVIGASINFGPANPAFAPNVTIRGLADIRGPQGTRIFPLASQMNPQLPPTAEVGDWLFNPWGFSAQILNAVLHPGQIAVIEPDRSVRLAGYLSPRVGTSWSFTSRTWAPTATTASWSLGVAPEFDWLRIGDFVLFSNGWIAEVTAANASSVSFTRRLNLIPTPVQIAASAWPVGSIYESIDPNQDPGQLFGGTWQRIGGGSRSFSSLNWGGDSSYSNGFGHADGGDPGRIVPASPGLLGGSGTAVDPGGRRAGQNSGNGQWPVLVESGQHPPLTGAVSGVGHVEPGQQCDLASQSGGRGEVDPTTRRRARKLSCALVDSASDQPEQPIRPNRLNGASSEGVPDDDVTSEIARQAPLAELLGPIVGRLRLPALGQVQADGTTRAFTAADQPAQPPQLSGGMTSQGCELIVPTDGWYLCLANPAIAAAHWNIPLNLHTGIQAAHPGATNYSDFTSSGVNMSTSRANNAMVNQVSGLAYFPAGTRIRCWLFLNANPNTTIYQMRNTAADNWFSVIRIDGGRRNAWVRIA